MPEPVRRLVEALKFAALVGVAMWSVLFEKLTQRLPKAS
jgi:hypothetical protein